MTAAGGVPLLVGWVPAVLVVGLLVGSFLNVVVHRVPAGLSIVRPGSACPGCGHAVRARDNVPVVSWLVLHGRCRDCSVGIPVRYPLVEAGTGVLFVAIAVQLDRLGQLSALAACLVVAGAGVALALIDLEHGRLPFPITGVAAVLAVLGLVVGGWDGDVSMVGVVLSAAIWLAVYGGLWLGTAGRGMGLGDVALAPLLGGVLGAVGVGASMVGLAAGFVVGAVVGVALAAAGRGRLRGRVPHGPFMLVGAALGLFAGPALSAAYLSLLSLR